MPNFSHSIGQIEGTGALFAAGRIQLNGTTLSMTQLSSPVAFTSDITASRVSAGRYQVTLSNFKGPVGIVLPTITVGSTSTAALGTANPGLSASIYANSYTAGTDTYSFTIAVHSGNTATDADVYWYAWAF